MLHLSPPPRPLSRGGEKGKVWLEQLVALATLCGTAADWNRNWPIHVSLQAGSGPCLVLTDYLISIQTARVSAPLLRCGKAAPHSLFLKAPRALLSSPISCLNYAPFCAVVFCFFFLFLPSSSPASPSSSPPPPVLLSVSHFTVFRRFQSLKSDAGTVLTTLHPPPPPPPPPPAPPPSPVRRLPSIVSSPEREYGVFDA